MENNTYINNFILIFLCSKSQLLPEGHPQAQLKLLLLTRVWSTKSQHTRTDTCMEASTPASVHSLAAGE